MAIRQGGLYRRPAPDKPAELVHRTKPAPAEVPPAAVPQDQATAPSGVATAANKSRKKGG